MSLSVAFPPPWKLVPLPERVRVCTNVLICHHLVGTRLPRQRNEILEPPSVVLPFCIHVEVERVPPEQLWGGTVLTLRPRSRNPVASKSLPVSTAIRQRVNKSRQTPERSSLAPALVIRAKFRRIDRVMRRKRNSFPRWCRAADFVMAESVGKWTEDGSEADL